MFDPTLDNQDTLMSNKFTVDKASFMLHKRLIDHQNCDAFVMLYIDHDFAICIKTIVHIHFSNQMLHTLMCNVIM